MSIWFKKDWDIDKLNQFGTNTMNELIGIRFTEVGENYLKAVMPVDNRTRQAYGLLHGGASVTLAERSVVSHRLWLWIRNNTIASE